MIYTFGDGFAAGHIWPEWPQFIELTTGQSTINYGHIGAGNEFIFNCAVKASLIANSSDIFLVQWAIPNRFDKLIEDQTWNDLHKSDPIYKEIQATQFNQTWWSTSASELDKISEYKSFYVQDQQAVNRSILYMISLSKMLDFLNIKHVYFLTYNFDYSQHQNYDDLVKLPWVDLTSSMQDWSKNLPERGNEIQPAPKVHFKYVVEKILPKLDFNFVVTDDMINLIDNYQFTAFDPDRDYIWNKFKNEFSLLF
jgi:hypothetical protein